MAGRIVRARALGTALALTLVASACGVQLGDDAGRLGADTRPDGRSGVDGDVIGSGIGPTTTSSPPTTVLPPDDIEVIGDDGSDLNKVAANAIADLEAFWEDEFPKVYGDPYEPVAGGFYAIDSDSDPRRLPCAPPDVDAVLYNAYYCPQDDALAWDQEGLFPDLAGQFGDFVVAVVLAHEWGHAIQARAGTTLPTVTMELQADCFAGAWVRHVRNDDDARFEISTEDLDFALAGILSLRDAPGSLADDLNAHGSGFDRVGAFQDGYEDAVGRCTDYRRGDPTPYQFALSDQDVETGGDLEFEDHVGADGEVESGIEHAAFDSLEAYWVDEFPQLADRAWKPLADPIGFSTDDPPSCDGTPVTEYRLFYCVPDRYVGYDDTVRLPEAAEELGDFAAGYLFGTQYGLAVQHQLGIEAPGEVTATLRADCFAGAWSAALLPTDDSPREPPYVLYLSPGDLDEAVAVLLSFRSDSDRDRQGPGFERVKAFRRGVVGGSDGCADLRAG